MARHQSRVLPGFRCLNIFLQAMYCNGAVYLLLKASTSQRGAASTGPHRLYGDESGEEYFSGMFMENMRDIRRECNRLRKRQKPPISAKSKINAYLSGGSCEEKK